MLDSAKDYMPATGEYIEKVGWGHGDMKVLFFSFGDTFMLDVAEISFWYS